jgi:uncharacterized lipoprotein YajG
MRLNFWRSAGLFFFTLVLLSGCAFTTAHVNLSYSPDSKSPLMTIETKRVALQVEDHRPPEEKDKIGNKKNGFGMVTASVQSNKEVTAVLYDSLKNELENNGHKIVNSKDDSYDIFINVLLNKYWCDAKPHFFDVEMIGIVSAQISIQDPRNAEVVLSKSITGTSRESRQIATDGNYESVLNGALAEFVRHFSRDNDILKAIRDLHSE